MSILDTLDGLQIKEQFVDLAGSLLATPSLIILFLSLFFIFLVVGLIFVKTDRLKFLEIWGISLILGLIPLLMLIFMPNTVMKFTEWIKELI